MKKDFSKKILVGITGYKDIHWQRKLREIDKFGITKVALFLERFDKNQRKKIYKALLESRIKDIPLVHIRNDMTKEELSFLVKNFGSLYLTIHEDSFNVMQKWRGFFKRLYLEMNTDNFISRKVDVSRIGGFCIDLAHFKVEATKWSKEFIYIFNRRATKRYFKCNHLNGYSYEKNTDIHFPKKLSDFDYLKTLPKFVFGDVIALEMDNSISTQLKYKDYIVDILNEKFNVKK
ncbi:hypothetical protein J7K03_00455 [bacterium]|nr:hypothetical protein [bacterium]